MLVARARIPWCYLFAQEVQHDVVELPWCLPVGRPWRCEGMNLVREGILRAVPEGEVS